MFPDRIERTLLLNHSPENIWAALTSADGLGTWFGQRAEVDLRIGGLIFLGWDSGDTAVLTIERLEPPWVFGWSWRIFGLPDGDPRRTSVEFTLVPAVGGTRLTMIETGFGQLPGGGPHGVAFTANTTGWTSELGELVEYLDGRD